MIRMAGVLLAALAICAPAACSGSDGPSTTTITCTAVRADSGDLQADVATLRSRASALGQAVPDVRTKGLKVVVSVRGLSRAAAPALCANDTLEFRGLVSPAAAVGCTGTTCRAREPAALSGVRLPAASAVYASGGLAPATYRQVTTALAATDCAGAAKSVADPTGYRLACGPDPANRSRTVAYLLGPVVVSGQQIQSAQAVPPARSNPQWTVTLRLRPTGSRAWSRYTTAHNTGGSTDATATAGSCGPTPCSDFVGFVHNGRVLSAPVNQGAINGQATQIAGNFDRASATALARSLNGGTLPVPLRVVSVSTGS